MAIREALNRDVEHGLENEPSSPMNPPQPFHLAGIEKVALADLAAPLQELVAEHKTFLAVLDGFESALVSFKSSGWMIDKAASDAFAKFFNHMDHETPRHNAKEEKALFPILQKKLIAAGECSPGERPSTAIDVMEDDHLRVMQSVCLVFNLLGISSRLKDPESRATVCQIACDQGREIAETMRLHVFKENEVLFPRAQQLIAPDEMEYVREKMATLP